MNTVQKMRAALAGEITVRTWWGCPGLSGEAFLCWFLDCLMVKINRHDRRQGRRLMEDYQTSLYRDARRRHDIQRHVIHRQFETDIKGAALYAPSIMEPSMARASACKATATPSRRKTSTSALCRWQ